MLTDDELDALDALLDHAVDGVLTAAADADHFDLGKIFDKLRLRIIRAMLCSFVAITFPIS